MARSSPLHHIELWVPDLARAQESWGWLLTRLGAEPFQTWEHGRSWRWDAAAGGVYVVVEQSPALVGDQGVELGGGAGPERQVVQPGGASLVPVADESR